MSERLDVIAKELKANRRVDPVTVRSFLGWFGVQRRRASIVSYIRAELLLAGVKTVPDFEGAWIDSEITFELRKKEKKEVVTGDL